MGSPNNVLVSDEMANSLIDKITESTIFEKKSIHFEIQDDFKFLLLTINTHDKDSPEIYAQRIIIRDILNSSIPRRDGEYSWMVNFKFHDEVVDSYFGGDTQSPDSGL